MDGQELKYLKLLAQKFPTIAKASTEIINLEAILNLPKGTEHFISDLHGEFEAFRHVLKNASGTIKSKVAEMFGTSLRESEQQELCTLIYYPRQKLEKVKEKEKNMKDWYNITLHQLVSICQNISSKYTRSKVRKMLTQDFSYIIEELLHETSSYINKQEYCDNIIKSIIEISRADEFIIEICTLIQRFAIDRLHLVGDIYDRGPGAHLIIDTLMKYKDIDIQWGNHDINWIGAAAGCDSCIANVVRICLRYGNLETLEDGYGINLLPLGSFAMDTYKDDPCERFKPNLGSKSGSVSEKTVRLIQKMHKAISIIQFKLEAQLINRHPEYKMDDRKQLEYIIPGENKWIYEGKEYEMQECNFPTIDPANPYELTPEEAEIVRSLNHSFRESDKLQKHMQYMLSRGSMYLVCNGNLLYHASIPLTEDGQFKEVLVNGSYYRGKELLKILDQVVRTAFNPDVTKEERQNAIDYIWYLWCGPDSPLFDKDKMTTFERYFLKDKDTHKEKKGFYYKFRDKEDTCNMILDEFGVQGNHRHIINGHVPVKAGTEGESPIKANGKMLVIDGGFAKAYQETTGIAGYTLIFHSKRLQLVQHDPFTDAEDAVEHGTDIKSTLVVLEPSERRILVRDTDLGKELMEQVAELKKLLSAYRNGLIRENK